MKTILLITALFFSLIAGAQDTTHVNLSIRASVVKALIEQAKNQDHIGAHKIYLKWLAHGSATGDTQVAITDASVDGIVILYKWASNLPQGFPELKKAFLNDLATERSVNANLDRKITAIIASFDRRTDNHNTRGTDIWEGNELTGN